MKKIYLEPFQYQGSARIAIRFRYDISILEKVRLIPGRRWSKENRCWHIAYTDEKLNGLKRILSSEDVLIDDPVFEFKNNISSKKSSKRARGLQLLRKHQNQINQFSIWLENQRYSDRTCESYLGLVKSFLIFFW